MSLHQPGLFGSFVNPRNGHRSEYALNAPRIQKHDMAGYETAQSERRNRYRVLDNNSQPRLTTNPKSRIKLNSRRGCVHWRCIGKEQANALADDLF